eukprot:scaffold3751_cov117-Isochrysis_galbana.AAC.2
MQGRRRGGRQRAGRATPRTQHTTHQSPAITLRCAKTTHPKQAPDKHKKNKTSCLQGASGPAASRKHAHPHTLRRAEVEVTQESRDAAERAKIRRLAL